MLLNVQIELSSRSIQARYELIHTNILTTNVKKYKVVSVNIPTNMLTIQNERVEVYNQSEKIL